MPIITQTTPNQNSTVTTTTVNANSANTIAVLSPVYTNNSLINKTVNAAGSNSSFGKKYGESVFLSTPYPIFNMNPPMKTARYTSPGATSYQ